MDGVNYCFGLFLLPLVETFDVGSASVSLVCFVLERFGQATLGSWESSQRSLINNNTQVGSLCVGILSLLAPGTAWLTDRFGARLVQNFTLHTSNPNMASAISQEASSLVRGVTKTKTSFCGSLYTKPLHRGQLGCGVRNLTTWQDFSPFSWQHL